MLTSLHFYVLQARARCNYEHDSAILTKIQALQIKCGMIGADARIAKPDARPEPTRSTHTSNNCDHSIPTPVVLIFLNECLEIRTKSHFDRFTH